MGEVWNQENQTMKEELIEALKRASQNLQTKPIVSFPFNSTKATLRSLSDLDHFKATTILSNDSNLSKLTQLLKTLKTSLEKLENSQGYSLSSLIKRQIAHYEISRAACMIEREIQAWIDQKLVQNVVEKIEECDDDDEDDTKIKALVDFENRVSQGFDGDLQDLILKAKIFSRLEKFLCDPTFSIRIREQASRVIAALVRFNKDVFVGLVLMGPIIQALVSMATYQSIEVLTSLVKLIKSPLIDEIEGHGEITKIIGLLSSEDSSIRVVAMDCVLEIAYFGRKEAVEAMVKEELVEKLMELQRLENEGDLIEMDQVVEERKNLGNLEGNMEMGEREIVGKGVFGSCVLRFAVQLEVGEGLRQREKREVKLEILRRVREASVCDAEAATIVAKVLWGSSPMSF